MTDRFPSSLLRAVESGQPVASNRAQADELIAQENKAAAEFVRNRRSPRPAYGVTRDGDVLTIYPPEGEQRMVIGAAMVAEPDQLAYLLNTAVLFGASWGVGESAKLLKAMGGVA